MGGVTCPYDECVHTDQGCVTHLVVYSWKIASEYSKEMLLCYGNDLAWGKERNLSTYLIWIQCYGVKDRVTAYPGME